MMLLVLVLITCTTNIVGMSVNAVNKKDLSVKTNFLNVQIGVQEGKDNLIKYEFKSKRPKFKIRGMLKEKTPKLEQIRKNLVEKNKKDNIIANFHNMSQGIKTKKYVSTIESRRLGHVFVQKEHESQSSPVTIVTIIEKIVALKSVVALLILLCLIPTVGSAILYYLKTKSQISPVSAIDHKGIDASHGNGANHGNTGSQSIPGHNAYTMSHH